MFDEIRLGREFFMKLWQVDAEVVERVAAAGCGRCGGRLHRGDYPRKGRGGLVEVPEELFGRRFSLCCGREGCRRRTTPPSVRFLGRRVYVGAVVLVGSLLSAMVKRASKVRESTGIGARTTRRWLRWWRGPFTATRVFVELSARLMPPVSKDALPRSLVERLAGDGAERVGRTMVHLAPLTTTSTRDGARFLREVA